MTQLQQMFDANQYDPTQTSGASLPVGKHPVVIDASEIKATQDNSGGFLELTLKIIDGPQTGTTGAYRLNLYNQSQKAVEIAHRQFSALCHAVKVFQVQDSAQLHNIPFIVEVALQKGQDANGYTEVKKVFDINGNEPGKNNAGQAAAAPSGFGSPQGQPQQNATPQGAAGGNWNQPQQGGGNWGGNPAQGQPVQNNQQTGNAGWNQNATPQGAAGGAAPWTQNQQR
jgi:hypothetical protein